jgi:hypothetical protein
MLFEAPFTDINSTGVAGLFEDQIASKIISLIETINHNAEAALKKPAQYKYVLCHPLWKLCA